MLLQTSFSGGKWREKKRLLDYFSVESIGKETKRQKFQIYHFTNVRVCICAQSCPTLETPWTVAHQVLLSMEFSRQEYWSGLPFPTPGDLPDPGTEPMSLVSPALACGFFTNVPPEWGNTESFPAKFRDKTTLSLLLFNIVLELMQLIRESI